MLKNMFSFRNGSLLANALLVLIGAAAGAGMTVLMLPMARHGGMMASTHGTAGHGPAEKAPDARPAATASDDREKAAPSIAEAMQILDTTERATALRAAGAEAARKDPAEAISLTASFTSEQDKLEFLRGIYSVWGDTDPVAALSHANANFPAGIARSETIGIAINKWGSRDPRAAWLWSEENLSGPLKDQALTDVIIGWTRRSPGVAANWLASTGNSSQPLFYAAASTWAEQNALAAATWAGTLTNSDTRRTAEIAVASEWAAQRPAEAAEYYAAKVAAPDGAALATAIADIWGTTQPAAAAEWIAALPSGPGRDEAAATLATVWAASDIHAAIDWSTSLADSDVRRQVITHIGTTWGAMEPDKALAWLDTLPAALATDGTIGAFNSWAATDTAGLQQWVESNPPAPGMDQARLSLADVMAAKDITYSMNLAFQMSSQLGRDDAVARYYREWRKIDNDSAQEWLAQTWAQLAPTTQQRLTVEQYRPIVVR